MKATERTMYYEHMHDFITSSMMPPDELYIATITKVLLDDWRIITIQ